MSKKPIKNFSVGTSLAVQWLRLCLPMQVVWVPSLVVELDPNIPHGLRPKNQNIKTEAVL